MQIEITGIFLLFEIGLELPLERVRLLWRPALIGGWFQVAFTLAVVSFATHVAGLTWPAALVIGGGVCKDNGNGGKSTFSPLFCRSSSGTCFGLLLR